MLSRLYEYEKTGLDYYANVENKSPIIDRRLLFNEIEKPAE
jgi:hypothetical protein